MRITETADLWYKNAIGYCIDPETFLDSDGDGIGDLHGVTQRIDYLAEIGVNCIWLMPFYPSPRVDYGYDISDFYGVDPRFGDHGDLVELVRLAHDRGIRVIIDIVINHTSDQHPWFRNSARSTTSRYRDYYVWRAEDPGDTSDQTMFPDEENGIWTRHEETGEWYLHHFLHTQPDLNTANPEVRDAIAKMMGFWLQVGVDGFRVDTVPFALNQATTQGRDKHDFQEPHDYLRTLRSFLQRRASGQGTAIMLGEVNLPHEEQVDFFGGSDGDQLTMQFDFFTNQKLFLALARHEAGPLIEALNSRPTGLGTESQYANFLINHDELTLDLLPDDEREEVLDAFAPQEEMRIFGRGLRRRLPGMFNGDPRRLKMAYALLFALPGTPVLLYGEEIGLGENLDLPGREAVRSPMQWTNHDNAGFSASASAELTRSVTEGAFGPEHVNVAAARRDPGSLLHHIRQLSHWYRDSPELGWGDYEILDTGHPAVFAHRANWETRSTVMLHNLGSEPASVEFTVSSEEPGTELLDLASEEVCTLDENLASGVKLDGYGYRWLRVTHRDHPRLL